jgi:hypothetical protein
VIRRAFRCSVLNVEKSPFTDQVNIDHISETMAQSVAAKGCDAHFHFASPA